MTCAVSGLSHLLIGRSMIGEESNQGPSSPVKTVIDVNRACKVSMFPTPLRTYHHYAPQSVIEPQPKLWTHIFRAFCTRMYSQFTASLTPVLRARQPSHQQTLQPDPPFQCRHAHHVQTRHPLLLRAPVVPRLTPLSLPLP